MKIRLYLALCCVSILYGTALSEEENEVKRGLYPFMAFVYYPDETVVDSTGARFIRAAVLIRPQWLLSAAIDHPVDEGVAAGFPRKTLLARMGAIAINSNLTLNEDEDEQEREIIEIVRPNLHNLDNWWFTDITLLKTLLPFNTTYAVAVASLNAKREYSDKSCFMLVYAKRYGNVTEDKNLMQLSVELLTPSIENCGNQFSETTMTCANDSGKTKTAVYDPKFCQGNSGGPLLCEGDVMGLQTYIEGNCRQPHLYQLLSSWESFIGCGTSEKCNQEFTCNICTVTNKDSIMSEKAIVSTSEVTTVTNTSTSPDSNDSTRNPPVTLTSDASITKLNDDESGEDQEDKEDKEQSPTMNSPKPDEAEGPTTNETITRMESDKEQSSTIISPKPDETEGPTTNETTYDIRIDRTRSDMNSTSSKTSVSREPAFRKWPDNTINKKTSNNFKKDHIMRMAKVEAQHAAAVVRPDPPPYHRAPRSAASKNLVYFNDCLVNSVAIVFTLLLLV